MPFKDPQKRKESQKRYKAANREKVNETQRRWRESQGESLKQKQREYSRKHYLETKEGNRADRLKSRKIYIKDNTEKPREWRKNNYAKHKSAIREKRKSYLKTLNGRYVHYKSNAKHTSKRFNLSLKEFSRYWQKSCHYCGDSIELIGLDRIDALKGYVVGNVVSCCKTCNYMKKAYTKEFFIEHCKKIGKRASRGLI